MKVVSGMEIFSQNVRTCLRAHKWSQGKLADRTKIARAGMSRVLSGDEGITLDRADRIAKGLATGKLRRLRLSDLVDENFTIPVK